MKRPKNPILRWIAIIVAAILLFAAGFAVTVFATGGSFSGIIEDMFPKKDIDISIEGETENIPHAPGGQEPSSQPDLPEVIPGFVIYYDTDRYVMTEEDGVTYIRFELPEEYPPCEMEIRHVPNTTAAAAIASARTEALADARWQTVSEIGPVETPAGLHFSVCSGNQWDSAWENVYFVSDGKNGCFRIISRYFVEAAEGHGARFAAMLQTFEVVAG